MQNVFKKIKMVNQPILIRSYTVLASENTVTVNGMLNIPENREGVTETTQLSILKEAYNIASCFGYKIEVPKQTHFNFYPMRVGEDGRNRIFCPNCGAEIASYRPDATKNSPNWEWGVSSQCNEHTCEE
jgi:hypothetical protein